MAVQPGLGRSDQSRKFHEALCEELIAFAEQEFRAARVKADGSTERQHNEAADRIRAGLPKKKQAKQQSGRASFCPPDLIYLWNWFVELLGGSSGGGSGPAIIAWVDVKAWSEMTGEVVEPWEVRLMMRLSTLRAEIEGEEIRKSLDGAAGKGRAG